MISRRAGQCGSGRNRNHHQRSAPKRRLLGEATFAHQPLRAQHQVGRLHSVSWKWCGLAGGNRYRAGLRSRRLTCTGSLPAILSPTIKTGMLASIIPSVVAVTTGRMWTPHGCPHTFRLVGGYRDADLLRLGRSQPNVHPGLRCILCPRFRLRIPARGVALRIA